jgi:hypothetical protein
LQSPLSVNHSVNFWSKLGIDTFIAWDRWIGSLLQRRFRKRPNPKHSVPRLPRCNRVTDTSASVNVDVKSGIGNAGKDAK